MSEKLIELLNVSYIVKDANKKRELLKKINYSFEKGVISIISGPSGSGKSTLLYAIAGLLNGVSGDIIIEGDNIICMTEEERNAYRLNNISMVFQNLNLFSFMSVEDNILVPIRLKNKKVTPEIQQRVLKYLELMKLGDVRKKNIQSLSGGEQQRVAIIRALIDAPKVVLCDEPTASLDEENVKIFMDTLVEIKNTTNATFIIVTHDARVLQYAEQKIKIVDGHLVN